MDDLMDWGGLSPEFRSNRPLFGRECTTSRGNKGAKPLVWAKPKCFPECQAEPAGGFRGGRAPPRKALGAVFAKQNPHSEAVRGGRSPTKSEAAKPPGFAKRSRIKMSKNETFYGIFADFWPILGVFKKLLPARFLGTLMEKNVWKYAILTNFAPFLLFFWRWVKILKKS